VIAVRLQLDGRRIARRAQLPAWLRGPVRREQRRIRRIRSGGATGAQLGYNAAFKPLISIRSVSGTETCALGATTLTYEVWGNGGGGGGTLGSGCAISAGGGGGGGGQARGNFTVTTKGGLTWTVTIGAVGTAGIAGGANGGTGATNTVNAGTMTGWSNISCVGGGGGITGGGAAAAGGTVTNANAGATNTTGNVGGGAGTAGGASIAGIVTGDGQPGNLWGAGGNGHGSGTTGNGNAGNVGAAVFSYV